MSAAIETTGLVRRFGRTDAVNGLTMTVPEGSVFALIGPNGAGKTTTIKLLMNLLRPSGGMARVLGADVRRLGPAELRRIGYVSENQRLPDWMTPAQLLRYCRAFYPSWDAALERRLQASLGLTQNARLRSLSRGTRMKVALLASLAYRPELVVLDEPFTGLDPVVRDELIRALLDASGDRRWTVLISSHDVDEVERLADWIAFLDAGRLRFAEPTASLLARFRRVEVVSDDPGLASRAAAHPRWIVEGIAGRTLRFVDTAHDEPDAARGVAATFPGADIRIASMPLREIFIALAGPTPPGVQEVV
ncbi:MAG TPA: ABC transporter ATP-binding protein [Vicinamibacterales bacterium]|nr:ABC transporter ATP-binding protein [Vicinamibacterales bacterium]